MLLSHFVTAYPSSSPCPQVHSLCLRLHSCPARLAVLDKVVREGLLEEVTVGPKFELGPGARQAKVLEQRGQQVRRLC